MHHQFIIEFSFCFCRQKRKWQKWTIKTSNVNRHQYASASVDQCVHEPNPVVIVGGASATGATTAAARTVDLYGNNHNCTVGSGSCTRAERHGDIELREHQHKCIEQWRAIISHNCRREYRCVIDTESRGGIGFAEITGSGSQHRITKEGRHRQQQIKITYSKYTNDIWVSYIHSFWWTMKAIPTKRTKIIPMHRWQRKRVWHSNPIYLSE